MIHFVILLLVLFLILVSGETKIKAHTLSVCACFLLCLSPLSVNNTTKNIGLQFLASGLSISHEIRQIS